MPIPKNLRFEAESLQELWSPKVVGELNDQYVKVAKVKGELAWHKHDEEDEMFFILQGALRIEYEGSFVELSEGDFHIVPKGTMHNPVCEDECLIVLIESKSTKHTGDVVIEKTVSIINQLEGYSDAERRNA